jgi:hypothetical protein
MSLGMVGLIDDIAPGGINELLHHHFV